jgi:hypothetical protein
MPRPLTPDSDHTRHAEPPLWSIGLAAAVIIVAPIVMYNLAPAGPIREGDTVFSNGSHKVRLSEPDRYKEIGYADTCLIDPSDPLIITRGPASESDDTMGAQIQGKSKVEWPFCPPQAEIHIKLYQLVQKPNILQDFKDSVLRVFNN